MYSNLYTGLFANVQKSVMGYVMGRLARARQSAEKREYDTIYEALKTWRAVSLALPVYDADR